MDAINELQRQLGGPVVAFVGQYWAYFAIAAVALILWMFGFSRRQVIRPGWTFFPDRNGRSRLTFGDDSDDEDEPRA